MMYFIAKVKWIAKGIIVPCLGIAELYLTHAV